MSDPQDAEHGFYLPGPPGSDHGDFWVGDVVRVHSGPASFDFYETDFRVKAINIARDDDNGELIVIPELVEIGPAPPELGLIPALLWYSADDHLEELYVNGTDASGVIPPWPAGGGRSLFPIPIFGGLLVTGTNVIAVKIRNDDFTNDWGHNPTGFRWLLVVDPASYPDGWPHWSADPDYPSPSGIADGYPPGSDGHTEEEWRGGWTALGGAQVYATTDNTKVFKTDWRYGHLADEPTDWEQPDFDDSGWDAAVEVAEPGTTGPVDGTYGIDTPDLDPDLFMASKPETDPQLDGAVFLARTTFTLS